MPSMSDTGSEAVAGVGRLSALLLLLLTLLCSPVSANFREREKQIIDEIIGPANYDKRIRPAGANDTGPAVVHINIMIRNVQTISDVKMEYSIQITFREQWKDQRLTFDNMQGRIQYLTLTETEMVWMPDLFFKNEKEGHFHNIILPNLYIRIYPDGGVLYSIRISLTLSCPMNLKLFPLDRQQCQLLMASYGWTTEDLVFLWKDVEPVQVTKNLHLPRFTLEKFITDYCNSKTNTGEYSCLRVDLVFKREFSYYLIQYYIPCCMLVIVSWVSFWLDQNAVPARVSLGVTTLLTMSTQTSSINNTLPPVSYTKAIDVWTGVCLTFVFGALLEFALVNYASRSDKHREKLKEKLKEQKKQWEMEHAAALEAALQEAGEDGHTFGMRVSVLPRQPAPPPRPRRLMDLLVAKTKPLVSRHNGGMGGDKSRPCEIHLAAPRQNCCRTWLSKFPTRSKRIDVISRITFPIVFAFFNMAYWSTYLFTEEEEDGPK
ncbi:glutamate-gated chloride channel-like isoform X2 [Portunus trituberculatus]|uniref:glutamate-gated chloride channel-like isoform X2 n=1 Tax=Portunus trituberculatus TaxID=210409 RepID=UPI001E1CE402|nr:glutamate-gated chloride channel-like isoform X2 [Portunus trituberculatus]